MNNGASHAAEFRLRLYIENLGDVIGHADRMAPLHDYCTGLLLPGERKSVEPIAALTEPANTQAQHQRLLHFVGQSPWSDDAMLEQVRKLVLPTMLQHGDVAAWIIDDTGFPKKGTHSVGVGRQYCGQLGKQDNCQVAVSLSVANHFGSLPIAFRLYLPEDWTKDTDRCRKAKVPSDIVFKTKSQIALDQIRAAKAAGVPEGIVLFDAGYGANTDFRDAITALGLTYSAGILSTTTVWPPGQAPLPPKPWTGRGRRPLCLRHDDAHHPVSVKDLALGLAPDAWQTITWREGSAEPLTSRFARLRVRPAHGDLQRHEPRPEEWLLIEWPEEAPEPTKYWLSTLPETISFIDLVNLTKLRWRIERDYQELKQEVGLGHFEGRSWRGFHHHASLCIAAYGFLISERGNFPPSGSPSTGRCQETSVPDGNRSNRAAHPTRTPHSKFDRHASSASHDRLGTATTSMPVLQSVAAR
jgi:SRSO17 transposase